jgi:hypothetical protein
MQLWLVAKQTSWIGKDTLYQVSLERTGYLRFVKKFPERVKEFFAGLFREEQAQAQQLEQERQAQRQQQKSKSREASL